MTQILPNGMLLGYLCSTIRPMNKKEKRDINNFWIAGINYKKTDAAIRGSFAINNDQYRQILTAAPEYNLDTFFILSTCNRTEIYGFSDTPDLLMNIICTQSQGDIDTFKDRAYIKNGWDAVAHLFTVSAGLDSQILGDYEILGQIKSAAKVAKQQGFIDTFLERLVNCALQASKAVKTHTALSGGTVSVAFAAIQYIKEQVTNAKGKKVLLLGTGKMGRNTCKNLVDYIGARNITLINRTEEKAVALAQELKVKSAPLEELDNEIEAADIVIVATNSPEAVILKHHLENKGDTLIIDLSVPCNVADDAKVLPNITFVDVDMLSKIKDENLQKRQGEVPKAVGIIDEHIAEFKEWYSMRRHVPMLKEVKSKLEAINTTTQAVTADPDVRIQKVLNTLAIKMKRNNTIGCHYIEAINDFIA